MRDPQRIERITKLLQEIWNEWPDQRFYQLISNTAPQTGMDLWFYEDSDLEDHFTQVLNEIKEMKGAN